MFFYSCRNDRKTSRAPASHGGNLLDNTKRKDGQRTYEWFPIPTSNTIQSCACILYWRYAICIRSLANIKKGYIFNNTNKVWITTCKGLTRLWQIILALRCWFYVGISSRKESFSYLMIISACPDKLFDNLSKSFAAKCITTLKEINMSFVPVEMQVRSLTLLRMFPNIRVCAN